MWIIAHTHGTNTKRLGLEPDTLYIVGRDEKNDFVVNSKAVSRQQLRIVIDSVPPSSRENTDYVTPITIEVLSRARSCINGNSYKLGKADAAPLTRRFSTNEPLQILFKNVDGNEDSTVTSVIRWFPFNVAVAEPPLLGKVTDISNRGMDLRVADTIETATHLLASPDSTAQIFKLALLKGLPIIALEKAIGGQQVQELVEKWLLTEAYATNYAPDHIFLAPQKKRSLLLLHIHGIIISGKESLSSHKVAIQYSEWICNLGGSASVIPVDDNDTVEKIDDRIVAVCNGATRVFVMNSLSEDSSVTNLITEICNQLGCVITTENDLLQNVKDISIAKMNFFTPGSRKRPAPEPAVAPSIRKRMRYQRVDKMHFFDLEKKASTAEATTDPLTQPHDSMDSQTQREIGDLLSISKTGKSTDPSSSNLDLGLRKQRALSVVKKELGPWTSSADLEAVVPEQVITEMVEHRHDESSTQRENNLAPDPNNKRIVDTDTPETSAKRFKPALKVSLVEAVKRAKDSSVKETNSLLGLGATQQSPQNNLERGFNTLVLVEKVPMTRSTPTAPPRDPNEYSGRKNFKNFRKNMALRPNITRTFIEMSLEAVNNEITFVSAGLPKSIKGLMNAKKQLLTDFKGIMGSVNGYNEPEELFVADSGSDYEEEALTYNRLGSSGGTIPTRNACVLRLTCYDDGDDDDDDDDGYGQPKFGFRTVR